MRMPLMWRRLRRVCLPCSIREPPASRAARITLQTGNRLRAEKCCGEILLARKSKSPRLAKSSETWGTRFFFTPNASVMIYAVSIDGRNYRLELYTTEESCACGQHG